MRFIYMNDMKWKCVDEQANGKKGVREKTYLAMKCVFGWLAAVFTTGQQLIGRVYTTRWWMQNYSILLLASEVKDGEWQ